VPAFGASRKIPSRISASTNHIASPNLSSKSVVAVKKSSIFPDRARSTSLDFHGKPFA